MMILVIEDNRLLSESVCALLGGHGFSTEAVYEGPAGLEFARTGVYDLIVLDVMLPGLDGFSLAASEEFPGTSHEKITMEVYRR